MSYTDKDGGKAVEILGKITDLYPGELTREVVEALIACLRWMPVDVGQSAGDRWYTDKDAAKAVEILAKITDLYPGELTRQVVEALIALTTDVNLWQLPRCIGTDKT